MINESWGLSEVSYEKNIHYVMTNSSQGQIQKCSVHSRNYILFELGKHEGASLT